MKKEMPKALTAKEWDAKKGVIAKMAGETGMGAALKKLDAAWAKVPAEALDPNQAFETAKVKRTTANFETLKAKAASAKSSVESARKEVQAVRDLATTLQTKWKASKVIPASSTKYVADMAKTADTLFIALRSYDRDWAAAGEAIAKEEERQRKIGLEAIASIFKSLRANADVVRATPTVSTYNGDAGKGFHQNVRGMAAALDRSKNDDWIAWNQKNWRPMAQDTFRPKTDSDVLPKVTQVLKALDELRQLVK